MNYKNTTAILGNVDIYLIDQILKNNYAANTKILDAGCGTGRNLRWFYANSYDIYGIDADQNRLNYARTTYPKAGANFQLGNLTKLPYNNASYDHVICCAVLHFAKNESEFQTMFSEIVRVLKQHGTLFIRMASDIGLDGKPPNVQDGGNKQEGSFYLTREIIGSLLNTFKLELLEPIKTTNVQDIRAMTTLMFRKM